MDEVVDGAGAGAVTEPAPKPVLVLVLVVVSALLVAAACCCDESGVVPMAPWPNGENDDWPEDVTGDDVVVGNMMCACIR